MTGGTIRRYEITRAIIQGDGGIAYLIKWYCNGNEAIGVVYPDMESPYKEVYDEALAWAEAHPEHQFHDGPRTRTKTKKKMSLMEIERRFY